MNDREFEIFLRANQAVQKQMGLAGEDQWAGSPFEWLSRLPSSTKGKAGEVLAAEWLGDIGLRVQHRIGAGHDRLVNGRKVEVKMSTLWAAGMYKFQQLRDQDYELLFLLGLSPNTAHVWVVPKNLAWEKASWQHGGKAARDTKWIAVRPNAPPEWLQTYGGGLAAAATAAKRELGSVRTGTQSGHTAVPRRNA